MPDIDQKQEIATIDTIFGKPPGWILHWGITVGIILIFGLLGLASFVRYPDKLYMDGQLISGSRPIDLVPKTGGVIDSIYVSDKDTVSSGDFIITMESTLVPSAVQKFYHFADRWDQVSHIPDYLKVFAPDHLDLGELTVAYSELVKSVEEFHLFLKDGSVFSKIKGLEQEKGHLQSINQSLHKQENYYEKNMTLTEKDFGRFENLLKDGVIAPSEKEKAEVSLYTEKRNLEAFKSQKINNDMRWTQLHTQISDLTAERRNGVNNRIFTIRQQIKELKGYIKEWENKHQLKAPIDAIISFTLPIEANTFIEPNKPVCTLIPIRGSSAMIIEGLLPVSASGTLQIGQKAIIDIENYPSAQFGTLSGIVQDISLIPQDQKYRVKVSLRDGLKTSYQKVLPPSALLSAKVTILTKEYSLLERLFQNVVDIMRNKNG